MQQRHQIKVHVAQPAIVDAGLEEMLGGFIDAHGMECGGDFLNEFIAEQSMDDDPPSVPHADELPAEDPDLESSPMEQFRHESPDIAGFVNEPPDWHGSDADHADVVCDVSAEQFVSTHQEHLTTSLQALARRMQDACLQPGHNGQMSLIRTHDATPGGAVI